MATTDERDATPRQLLQKAYVLMSFGFYQRAMDVCETAAARGDDPLVAHTLQGAILTASGRPTEGMRRLMGLHRRNREAILTALYLAEACFLAGRTRRGWKVLDGIDEGALENSPYSDFADHLRSCWQQFDGEALPEPVEVPLAHDNQQPNEQQ